MVEDQKYTLNPTKANIRQTDGLLPTIGFNIRRNQTNPHNLHPVRYTPLRGAFGVYQELRISLYYADQPSPDELPQAFIIREKFINNDNAALF